MLIQTDVWQEKQVFGSEAKVAGMGYQTFAFVRGFASLSFLSFFTTLSKYYVVF